MRSTSHSRTSSSFPVHLSLFICSFCHTLSPDLFSICVFPLPSPLYAPSSLAPRGAHFWCHLVSLLPHFLPTCPLFSSTIKPFHALLKFPRPPPRSLPLFPSVRPPSSRLLCGSSSLSLPLCSAHLQHIKIPLFFLQRIVRSLRDLLHSSMFSLPLSLRICPPPLFLLLVLAALHSV